MPSCERFIVNHGEDVLPEHEDLIRRDEVSTEHDLVGEFLAVGLLHNGHPPCKIK